MNKKEIRKRLIEIRKNIINKKELSTIIVDKLMCLDIYKNSSVIALYNSLNDEVNTKDLINESLKEKIVLLPRIIDNEMVFIKIDNDTKYIKSNFKVMEPIGEIYQEKIDLIIVPGVSFDKEKNRLGYGRAYYDRYLKNKDIYKIGLCFDEQIVDLLPNEKHDIKMNMVITNKRVYK